MKVRPAVSHWQRRDWEEEAVVRVGVGAGHGVGVGAGYGGGLVVRFPTKLDWIELVNLTLEVK